MISLVQIISQYARNYSTSNGQVDFVKKVIICQFKVASAFKLYFCVDFISRVHLVDDRNTNNCLTNVYVK